MSTAWNLPQHSYEEIREVVIGVIVGRESAIVTVPQQFEGVVSGTARVFASRMAKSQKSAFDPNARIEFHPYDAELVRDVFWDLFRQGFITLGMDSSRNAGWPWFRLSHFGKNALQAQSPFHFHDTTTFIAMVTREAPDILPDTVMYLAEAVAALYADCLLSSCVMLGVAAESEFLRLIDVATASATHGVTFGPLVKLKDKFIRSKITAFHAALKPIVSTLLPKKDFEALDTNLTQIQEVLRIARNDAGHPSGVNPPTREQIYVYLQMFVPFARQVMKLRVALA